MTGAIALARTPRVLAGRRLRLPADRWLMLVVACAAIVLRLPHIGDVAYSVDEQFYLLVGDRMVHGQLPYVDVWDRKPIGLFLIFAAARLLGSGVVPYQLLATGCAAGTALVIFMLVRRFGAAASMWAAAAYLVWIETVEGGGGQAPIFYNLPMAGAAYLTLTAIEDPLRRRRCGRWAMLLVGVAMQIKYTAMIEGLFFGLILAVAALRQQRWPVAAGEVLLLAAIALLPTLLATLFYVSRGALEPFWFANFVSIFRRQPTAVAELHRRATVLVVQVAPLAMCCALGLAVARHRPWQLFMLGWAASAATGVVMLGVLYPHYLLPFLVPLICGAAAILTSGLAGRALAALMLLLPLGHLHYPDLDTGAMHRTALARLVTLLPADVSHRCLLMLDGPPILYLQAQACAASRFAFPDHLGAAMEDGATGVDPAAALSAALGRRPAVVTSAQPLRAPNLRTYALLRHALTTYRLAGAVPLDGHDIQVWVPR